MEKVTCKKAQTDTEYNSTSEESSSVRTVDTCTGETSAAADDQRRSSRVFH